MEEKELQEKEQALTERENALNERENALNEREETLKADKEDTAGLVKQVKDEYEEKLLKQHDKYEERIKSREEVIKQLLSGNGNANEPQENVIIDKINARRVAQTKKW